ncbi:hypothetical protein PACTADRAFT_48257 [Pachysolen tannophilus NRRL Y-2460]|uniref:Uncharacterized protein n=1 Tax=Pachysolen tannophilus NRRL Y-2460 TaxID=669874 RepID=A0A1E4U3D3_PACTA|nr:hypothetical protein PACTADRAFT_48257 [Pachysolen tannophilus NRRL Y-2460]
MRATRVLSLLLFVFVPIISCALLGIDYGQEFTKSVLVSPGVPFEIVLTRDSKRKDTSGLALKQLPNKEIERIYGSATASYCARLPNACLLHLKSLLGKSIDDNNEITNYLSMHKGVSLVPSKNGRHTIAFDLAKMGVFSIEEAVGMSISEIKERAQHHLQIANSGAGYSTIHDVVITVPSFFTQAQRAAIRDAAEIANLKLVGLVDDGTAVAVNYVSSRQFDNAKHYHIIYDMGAGSTKATLFSVTANQTTGASNVEIEGVGFDDNLGGHHLTKTVMDILKEKFLKQYPKVKASAFENNERAMARLWQSAEKAKIVLSANNDARVTIENLFNDIDFKTVVSRDEFENVNQDLIIRMLNPVLDIFKRPLNKELTIDVNAIESVILTGGATRTPFVQQHLNSLIGGSTSIAKNVNADEAAVLGATLRGVLLSKMFKAKDISVIERSLYDYQISINNSDTFIDLFPRGSILGETTTLELTDLFNTTHDFSINLYENAELYVTQEFKNIEKAISVLDLNETQCAGGVKYFVTFKISESKFFSLEKLQAKCIAGEKSLFEKIIGSDKEDKEDDEIILDTKTEDDAKNKKKKISTILYGKNTYAKARPMSSVTKQSSIEKLRELSKKDAVRKQQDETRNLLEGALYDLRSYVQDDSDVLKNAPQDLIDDASDLASEYLEWLDYESDNASTDLLKQKLQDVKIAKAKIQTYLEYLNLPLDKSEFNKLHKEGLQTMHDLQDIMLTMAEDASSLQQNFSNVGLNWEEENKKIKLKLKPIDDSEVQHTFMQLNENLDKLVTMSVVDTKDKIQEDKSSEYDREELFELHEEINELIKKLQGFKDLLSKAHKQRTSALKKVLNKKIAKMIKSAKESAENEQKEQQKGKEKHKHKEQQEQTSEEIDDEFYDVTDDKRSGGSEESSESDVDHDEL